MGSGIGDSLARYGSESRLMRLDFGLYLEGIQVSLAPRGIRNDLLRLGIIFLPAAKTN
jgi:hypothetical protein